MSSIDRYKNRQIFKEAKQLADLTDRHCFLSSMLEVGAHFNRTNLPDLLQLTSLTPEVSKDGAVESSYLILASKNAGRHLGLNVKKVTVIDKEHGLRVPIELIPNIEESSNLPRLTSGSVVVLLNTSGAAHALSTSNGTGEIKKRIRSGYRPAFVVEFTPKPKSRK